MEGTKFTRTLYRGMRGNDVLRLQAYLAKNTNYFSLIPNGYYGAATETAVKRFQLSNNIVTVTAGATLSSGYGVFGKKHKQYCYKLWVDRNSSQYLSCKGKSLDRTTKNTRKENTKWYQYGVRGERYLQNATTCIGEEIEKIIRQVFM